MYEATLNNPELSSPKEPKADRDRKLREYQVLRAERPVRSMPSGLEVFHVASVTMIWS